MNPRVNYGLRILRFPGRTLDIEEEFEEFGAISSIFVARNPPGFAYVDFDDERDAKGEKLNVYKATRPLNCVAL